MNQTTIVDSTCLIVLERVGRLFLLRDLFARIVIPPEVEEEFGEKISWVEVQPVASEALFRALLIHLGRGEAAAIALASNMESSMLVLDDRKARITAKRMGLTRIGTIEVHLRAKRKGLVTELRGLLDEFDAAGFYVSRALRDKALHLAGEQS